MKTPSSLLRMMIASLGVAALVLAAGCRKPVTQFAQPKPPPPQAQSRTSEPTSRPTPGTGQEAAATVTAYVTHLLNGEYSAAYELLSRDSKQIHSLSDFEQQGKEQGMPSLDLPTAKATVTGDSAVVEVQQLEDPATHGYQLVRESNEWKIVYRGGVPGLPYAN